MCERRMWMVPLAFVVAMGAIGLEVVVIIGLGELLVIVEDMVLFELDLLGVTDDEVRVVDPGANTLRTLTESRERGM